MMQIVQRDGASRSGLGAMSPARTTAWLGARVCGCGLLISLLLAAPPPAGAADAAGDFIVLSMGAQPCSTYAAAYDKAGWKRLMHSVWVAGYLTAVNEHLAYGANVSARMDAEQREHWLYQYCQAHPDHTLSNAATSLLRYLIEQLDNR